MVKNVLYKDLLKYFSVGDLVSWNILRIPEKQYGLIIKLCIRKIDNRRSIAYALIKTSFGYIKEYPLIFLNLISKVK